MTHQPSAEELASAEANARKRAEVDEEQAAAAKREAAAIKAAKDAADKEGKA